MSHGGSFRGLDIQGGDNEEGTPGSDVVDWTTRVISMDIYDVLQNPDAPEWDSGTVLLEDGNQLHLWSEHSPAPASLPNSQMKHRVISQLGKGLPAQIGFTSWPTGPSVPRQPERLIGSLYCPLHGRPALTPWARQTGLRSKLCSNAWQV